MKREQNKKKIKNLERLEPFFFFSFEYVFAEFSKEKKTNIIYAHRKRCLFCFVIEMHAKQHISTSNTGLMVKTKNHKKSHGHGVKQKRKERKNERKIEKKRKRIGRRERAKTNAQ